MRALRRVVLGLFPSIAWLIASAQPAFACTGGDASLATGIHGASSIFYARIVALEESDLGFYELDLDIGRVIKGSGASHVGHLITPRACDGLKVGDAGVVVIRSVNPYGVGPTDIYNFFYVIGPGRTSAAEARAVLSGLPGTDTDAVVGQYHPGYPNRAGLLGVIAFASFGFATWYLSARPIRSHPEAERGMSRGTAPPGVVRCRSGGSSRSRRPPSS